MYCAAAQDRDLQQIYPSDTSINLINGDFMTTISSGLDSDALNGLRHQLLPSEQTHWCRIPLSRYIPKLKNLKKA